MAKQIITQYFDDVTGKPLTDEGVTVEMEYRGQRHTWDMNPDTLAKFEKMLEPYLLASTVLSTKKVRRRSTSKRNNSGAIRAWAQENGYEVSDRGRVPDTVVAAYHEAHAA